MNDKASRYRAAVVGSGFGGLAAAIRLQARGVRTVVFEKRDLPGGRAYVYRDQGYTFDAGPTVITAPQCLEELFAVAGRRMSDYVDMLPVRPFYRLSWPDGVAFDYDGDQRNMEEQIRRLSPGDVTGYRAFVEYARQVFQKGYEELAGVPFLRFADMVKVAPDLIRLRADRSVYGVVKRFVEDDHLRQALSFHSLLVGGNPFETSAIYTLIHYLERNWGVFFPRGGTGALVRALVKLYEEIGGELRLSTPVRRIDAPNGHGRAHRVTTDAGTEEFDLVVSNADVHHTYSKLYGGDRARPDDRPAPRAHGLVDVAVPDLLRHQPALAGPRPPHRRLRPALRGAAPRHLPRRAAARGLQPVPARADRHRPHDGPARAARPSTCSPRCRTSASRGSTGRRRAPPTPTASWPSSRSASRRGSAPRS